MTYPESTIKPLTGTQGHYGISRTSWYGGDEIISPGETSPWPPFPSFVHERPGSQRLHLKPRQTDRQQVSRCTPCPLHLNSEITELTKMSVRTPSSDYFTRQKQKPSWTDWLTHIDQSAAATDWHHSKNIQIIYNYGYNDAGYFCFFFHYNGKWT